MDTCVDCGEHTHSYYGNTPLCRECYHKREQTRVLEKSKTVESCSDFKEWDSGDMSELFWIHLGRYVKEPTEEGYRYMRMAFAWACHDNHGIANSFDNALKWAGINLWEEEKRWAAKRKENQ